MKPVGVRSGSSTRLYRKPSGVSEGPEVKQKADRARSGNLTWQVACMALVKIVQ